MAFSTRTTYTPKTSPIGFTVMGCCWPMYNVTMSIPWHREYWNIQLKAHLKPHSIKSSNTPAWPYQLLVCWYVCLLERVYLTSKNAAIMYGMYIINGGHGPEPGPSGGKTPSNPQVLALIPRPDFNGMERMFQRHGNNQNSHPPVLVRKPLCN